MRGFGIGMGVILIVSCCWGWYALFCFVLFSIGVEDFLRPMLGSVLEEHLINLLGVG